MRTAGWLVARPWSALAVAAGRRARPPAGPASDADRARDIAESVACPACDGQSVADSDAEAAKGIRAQIADRIDAGACDDEIRAELAAATASRSC